MFCQNSDDFDVKKLRSFSLNSENTIFKMRIFPIGKLFWRETRGLRLKISAAELLRFLRRVRLFERFRFFALYRKSAAETGSNRARLSNARKQIAKRFRSKIVWSNAMFWEAGSFPFPPLRSFHSKTKTKRRSSKKRAKRQQIFWRFV